MSAQLLVTELGNLLQESKRKHSELRGAVEKSLEELKLLRQTSETQFAADLAERPNFVSPFIIACGTKNVKFTGIAIVCLQRLSVSRALPRSRLREVLESFREASSSGLDIQLKILQALPSLLQNYAQDLQRNLIATTLNICITLQGSKNGIVSNTAAATLQQLVVSIFDKVVAEDKIAQEVPIAGEAPSENGPVQLRAAALDACEVFNDLCLLTESEKPLFLKSAGIPKAFGLELIESVLINHARIFLNHPEQASILRLRVMPFIINSLSEKLDFAFTVRIIRILYNLLRFHLSILSSEGEMALGLLTSMLDHDTAIWKRSLCMEVMKGIFGDAALVRRIYAMYDAQQGRKAILLDLVATIVRISSENPSIIGLGQQSSIPYSNQSSNIDTDQAMLEASGVPGIIGSSVSLTEPGVGISVQWSMIRVPCIEQLDKTEPPSVPGSYIYSLSLACLSGFSEGLAKFILPLTVPLRSSKSRSLEVDNKDLESSAPITNPGSKLERQASLKKNPVPINPMSLETHHLFDEIKTCASIVEQCWPAILAACSTFLYAALDTEYYRSLIRAFQKFTHVSGLLHLSTPRDAFLTTLAKAAVPSNILTQNVPSSPQATGYGAEKQGIFSNAKGLLSGETLISEKGKLSSEVPGTFLNTRNLLCLRALLNLGIALGPTLDSAWMIIFGALQHADLVIFSSNKAKSASTSHKNESQNADEVPSLFANFAVEIKAVETAAVRLLESTREFPDKSFVEVVNAICFLLGKDDLNLPGKLHEPSAVSKVTRPSRVHKRTNSLIMSPVVQTHEDLFALVKLSNISSINIERLTVNSPETSSWTTITSKFISVSCSSSTPAPVRLKAIECLISLVLEAATVAVSLPSADHSVIQLRLLDTLYRALQPLESHERKFSVSNHATDIDVHKVILEGLKSILEQCGETFVNGWDVAFAIIGSVFIKNRSSRVDTSLKESNATTTQSAKLIRPAFNSLQLICSDFLSSLSNDCFILLIDTLHNFCTQDDDLNISLTTITFFWVLSDFISGRTVSFSLSSDFIQSVEHLSLVEMAGSEDSIISDAALWMLLLLRLTAVTTDDRLELRNSAGQTLFRIFDTYGDQLSSEAWSMCLKLVFFNLLTSIEERLKFLDETDVPITKNDKNGWYETAVVVLNGLSSLLTNYIEVLAKHSTFGKSWQNLLKHFNSFLDFHIININTAVFKALQNILSKGNHKDYTASFESDAIDLAWNLWSESFPVAIFDQSGNMLDNENYLLAYVSVLKEIYRLIQWKLDASHVKKMLTLLRTAIINASAANYSADTDYLTSLQAQVLEIMTLIRTDVQGVPATIISQVAKIVELAFLPKDVTEVDSQRPTYVALSKASMIVLENLIVAHASDHEIYNTGAMSASLDALATPIVLKYSFPNTTKSISPWRQATISAVSILKSILPIVTNSDLSDVVAQTLWSSIVKICSGVTRASCSEAAENVNIRLDEEFDIGSLLTLRELIIPALGSTLISNKTRRVYIESLFYMSLIHTPLRELPQSNLELLSSLSHHRKGQTVDPAPTARLKMSYVCFDELISLVSSHDGSNARIKLAQVAAPYLILRAGLTLRMYIADQPLRGMMPQPLTQRKELLYILKALVDLRCEPEAILDIPGVGSKGKKHLFKLYPLFAKAVRAATRDQEVLECLGQALDAVGEFGPGIF